MLVTNQHLDQLAASHADFRLHSLSMLEGTCLFDTLVFLSSLEVVNEVSVNENNFEHTDRKLQNDQDDDTDQNNEENNVDHGVVDGSHVLTPVAMA